MVIAIFSPVRYRSASVATKVCKSLTPCFTQGVLPNQHGAGEVPESQIFFHGLFHIRFLYLLSEN